MDIALSIVSGLGLVLTGGHYLWYRRHRAELDAAGAEVMGEWLARSSAATTANEANRNPINSRTATSLTR